VLNDPQLIGPAGNSRETLFAKSGTDGSNPVPSSGESCKLHFASPALVTSDSGRAGGPKCSWPAWVFMI